jgi:N-acetylneuraminate synthase
MGIKLVGEIGINHNGDMVLVKQLIDVASLAGLDYIKFQKRDVESCYTKEFLDKYRESPWGNTQRDQKNGLELSFENYCEIDRYTRECRIGWFASPWDPISVKFLDNLNSKYIKIASASITDFDILEKVKQTNRPVIISTGMSTKTEVDKCLDYIGNQVEYILACTSTYPTKDIDINLNFIKTLKNEYPKYKIGFSNHSPGIQFCLSSATLGVEMIEFHMTLDRSMYGSDQSSSIEINGVLTIGRHIKAIEKAMGTGDWIVTPEEEQIKKKLRRSI